MCLVEKLKPQTYAGLKIWKVFIIKTGEKDQHIGQR